MSRAATGWTLAALAVFAGAIAQIHAHVWLRGPDRVIPSVVWETGNPTLLQGSNQCGCSSRIFDRCHQWCSTGDKYSSAGAGVCHH